MITYKITNLTAKLGKRDANFNSTLKIGYLDGMERKHMYLKPTEEIYFTTDSLPISLHKYRVKGLVSISDVTYKELRKIQGENLHKPQEDKPVETKTTTVKKKTTVKKAGTTAKKNVKTTEKQ